MNKIYQVLIAAAIFVIVSVALFSPFSDEVNDDQLTAFTTNHPFNNKEILSKEEIKKLPKKDRPDLAMEREFLLTLDPILKRPAPERLIPIIKYVNERRKLLKAKSLPGSVGYDWNERGPNNVGGRTRAIMFDPNDGTNKKVWAGGVGGGLWYNNDITDANSEWQSVDDFWVNIAITCIAYDPGNTNVFYVGTGEGWYNSDAQRGSGLWKTTDGGATWAVLSTTTSNTYRYIQDVMVHPITSEVYVGTRSGLYRSSDAGTSFSQVLSGVIADLEIAADNMMFAAKGNVFTAGDILSSSTGNSGTWSSVNGNGFPTSGIGRVEISTAPSNANVLYAMTQDLSTYDVGGLYKSINQGASWTSLTMPTWSDGGNFARGQAWYDLISGVDPADENAVYIGGVDLFKTTDGGSSWTQLSNWYLNPTSVNYAHADQHAIVFRPGSPNTVLHGNDGGLSITTDGGDNFETRVNEYNVTQFYSCAINPATDSPIIVGGAQDNGSHYIDTDGIQSSFELLGGDGALCFIDQITDDIIIASSQNGNFSKFQNGGGRVTLIGGSTGSFINPADYDDRENILYAGIDNSTSEISRIVDVDAASSIETLSTTLDAEATHFSVSPYAAVGTTNLFVGTSGGGVFKITNAHDGSASTSADIGPSGSGSISCIEIGATENELLVTKSNYGITSVYYSSNGGGAWTSKEGDLPDMPVRWALFNPNNRLEVILATEIGVWGTNDISVGSPDWEPHVVGMANVRVDMLQVRDSDKEVVAGTHGRGFFTSSGFNDVSSPNLVAEFSGDATTINPSQDITFTDESTGTPDTWEWTFPGGSPAVHSGQFPPPVIYPLQGCYNVKLIVTRNAGAEADTMLKTCYINVVTDLDAAFSADLTSITAGDTVVFTDGSAGTPETWDWVFTGGAPAAFTGQVPPAIQYQDAGCFEVSLTITKDSGVESDTETKTCYINVDSKQACEDLFSYDVDNAYVINNTDLDDFSIQFIDEDQKTPAPDLAANGWTSEWLNVEIDGNTAMGAVSWFNPAGQASNWVIFGPITLPDVSASVSWKHAMPSNDYRDGYEVLITTTGSAVINFSDPQAAVLKTIADNDASTDGHQDMTAQSVNVPGSFLNKQVYIAFHHNADDMLALYLDDIVVNGCKTLRKPTADFVANQTLIGAGGAIDFTDLSIDDPEAWLWNFNGGIGNNTDQHPQNVVFENAGCYDIQLIASSTLGEDSITKSCYIEVIELPVADFEADKLTILEGESVDFTDLSTNNPDNWSWIFTGATTPSSITQNPTGILYENQGCYEVKLNVSTQGIVGQSTTKTCYITVLEVPDADFTANKTTIGVGETVNFTDLSSGDVDEWTWSFNGANTTTSVLQNPTGIQYDSPGMFTVSLTVNASGSGTDIETKIAYIEVIEPPKADFMASDTTIDINQSISFTDLTDGDVDAWLWLFSGAKVTGSIVQNPAVVTYENEGCFEVKLRVFYQNVEGVSKTKTCYVTVVDRTGIKETLAESLVIYPNPINNVIKFKGIEREFDFELYNTTGQLVKYGVIQSELDVVKVGNLNTGNYYLKLKSGNETIVKNVVITR
jgi:PKD repeat protein